MKRDNTEIKKNVFKKLKDLGFVNDEIRRALGCSERTLYRWQAEDENETYEKEIEQKKDEKEQKLQKEINELKEHLERLSNYYTNLWRELHTPKEPSKQEKAEAILLDMMLERSFKNEKVIDLQRERTKEIWEIHQAIEKRPLTDPIEDDLRWTRLMDRWDKILERTYLS